MTFLFQDFCMFQTYDTYNMPLHVRCSFLTRHKMAVHTILRLFSIDKCTSTSHIHHASPWLCQKHAVILRKHQSLFFHNNENSDHFVGAWLMKTSLLMTESICALSFSHKHAIHCNVHWILTHILSIQTRCQARPKRQTILTSHLCHQLLHFSSLLNEKHNSKHNNNSAYFIFTS